MHPTHKALTQDLVERGLLHTPLITEAFLAMDRAAFVGVENQPVAYADRPLPIGHDQTISQPTTVAFMLELLAPHAGERILDIGAGSGWTTAILGQIAGPKGSVVATERVGSLVRFARENLARIGIVNATVREAQSGVLGAPDAAPFDRILVSAATTRIPDDLIRQLRIGGVMVLPINDALVHVERTGADEVMTQEYPGFAFVPLVEE